MQKILELQDAIQDVVDVEFVETGLLPTVNLLQIFLSENDAWVCAMHPSFGLPLLRFSVSVDGGERVPFFLTTLEGEVFCENVEPSRDDMPKWVRWAECKLNILQGMVATMGRRLANEGLPPEFPTPAEEAAFGAYRQGPYPHAVVPSIRDPATGEQHTKH